MPNQWIISGEREEARGRGIIAGMEGLDENG
jgi:hypothetical protein